MTSLLSLSVMDEAKGFSAGSDPSSQSTLDASDVILHESSVTMAVGSDHSSISSGGGGGSSSSYNSSGMQESRSSSALGHAPKIDDFAILKPISRGAFGKGEESLGTLPS